MVIVDGLEVVHVEDQQRRSLRNEVWLHTALKGGFVEQAGQGVPLGNFLQLLVHFVDFHALGYDGCVVVTIGERNGQLNNGCKSDVDLISAAEQRTRQTDKKPPAR